MRTALLGGTFNPIHNGHLYIAEEVRISLGYDRIVFVPSFRPAHKEIGLEDDPFKRFGDGSISNRRTKRVCGRRL
jgi:nicotinate-nucleotide adenylyltransferase